MLWSPCPANSKTKEGPLVSGHKIPKCCALKISRGSRRWFRSAQTSLSTGRRSYYLLIEALFHRSWKMKLSFMAIEMLIVICKFGTASDEIIILGYCKVHGCLKCSSHEAWYFIGQENLHHSLWISFQFTRNAVLSCAGMLAIIAGDPVAAKEMILYIWKGGLMAIMADDSLLVRRQARCERQPRPWLSFSFKLKLDGVMECLVVQMKNRNKAS